MTRRNRAILTLCYCVTAIIVMAQTRVDTRPHIFDNNVRSLKVCLENNMYIPPVLMISGDDHLVVSFDYIDYDVHYLRYSITH